VRCAESLRVQAYFDAEVDAVASADLERHAEHCAECRALLEDLEQVRGALRRDSVYARTPPALRARIMRSLDEENAAETAAASPGIAAGDGTRPAEETAASDRKAHFEETASRAQRTSKNGSLRTWRMRPLWVGAFGGAAGTAMAAALVLFFLAPRLTNPLLEELVNAHARSLMPGHLIDVVSTDKHTVKPWFAGHADVSPPVADFEPQGYKLIGGRADYLDHQRSAVVVYQHGAHVINVFSWADGGRALPGNVTRSGYHFAFFKAGDIDYCAVSDTGWDELSGLVRLLRE
jgi:anti-sigma factor RsiW